MYKNTISFYLFLGISFWLLLGTACVAGGGETAVSTPTTIPQETETPSSTATPAPTATMTVTPSATTTPRATTTSEPTRTPTQTPSPSPTATPVFQTKPILLQYGWFGGDGVDVTDKYFGRGTPWFVMYGDGQLLRKESRVFFESQITAETACRLLDEVAATGFLTPRAEEDYYTEREGSDGAEQLVVQIADTFYYFYAPDVPHLVPDLVAGAELVHAFGLAQTTDKVYQPESIVLWVEWVDEEWLTLFGYEDGVTAVPWPEHLPSIADKLPESPYGQVTLSGDHVQPIFDWFGNQMGEKFVIINGTMYFMIARPVLPHETPNELSLYPRPPQQYEPLLDCANEPGFISNN